MLRNRKLTNQQQELVLRIQQDQRVMRTHPRYDELLSNYQKVYRDSSDSGAWARLHRIYWELKNDGKNP